MYIKEAKTKEDFELILTVAKEHPEPEYDSYEDFCMLIRKMSENGLRGWILYKEESPVGYLMAYKSVVLNHQINVQEIFLKHEAWCSEGIILLLSNLRDWAREEKLKIVWGSKYPARVWERLLRKLIDKPVFKESYVLTWEVI